MPTPSLALSTLGTATAVTTGLTGASTSTYRAVSADFVWAIEDLAAGEGPITVGFAHSDYTVTEIKEALESAASIDQGLKIEQEKSNRLVRIVGTIGTGTGVNQLNDGKPVKTRLNWLITIGDEVNIFAYNDSSSSLTTGAILHPMGNLWVKDSA